MKYAAMTSQSTVVSFTSETSYHDHARELPVSQVQNCPLRSLEHLHFSQVHSDVCAVEKHVHPDIAGVGCLEAVGRASSGGRGGVLAFVDDLCPGFAIGRD